MLRAGQYIFYVLMSFGVLNESRSTDDLNNCYRILLSSFRSKIILIHRFTANVHSDISFQTSRGIGTEGPKRIILTRDTDRLSRRHSYLEKYDSFFTDRRKF